MKKTSFIFAFFLVLLLFGAKESTFAQNGPVMYFCEKYGNNGEVGISDRFTTGFLTVMVKSDYSLGLRDCAVQFDKWDPYSGGFKYYKKFYYTLEPDMKYVFFEKNSESDLNFEEPGFYRVFLLDDDDRTVTSALIQIVD